VSRTEICLAGFGGQGVVMSGYVIGRACAVNAGQHATLIQSFGPEARGSACSATLAISDSEVLYPYVQNPDIFVVMSAEGYEKFGGTLREGGLLIYEKDLVHPTLKEGQRAFGVPSTRIAESLGRTIVQNIVIVGFFAAVTQIVPRETMRSAVRDSVPPSTEELNLKAFDAGYRYFEETYGEADRAGAATPAAADGSTWR
jgi:2-oxoglutarate ferredoxin oxidoreductase subunit gamma